MAWMAQIEERCRITEALASMVVGERLVFPWPSIHALSTYRRQKACARLRNPDAKWSAQQLNHGVRVTRVR